jgi:hypothetical protein
LDPLDKQQFHHLFAAAILKVQDTRDSLAYHDHCPWVLCCLVPLKGILKAAAGFSSGQKAALPSLQVSEAP